MAEKHIYLEQIPEVIETRPYVETIEPSVVLAQLDEVGGATLVKGRIEEHATIETVEEVTWIRRPWHWDAAPKDHLATAGAMLGGGLLMMGVTALAATDSDASQEDRAGLAVLFGAGAVSAAASPVPLVVLGARGLQQLDTKKDTRTFERRVNEAIVPVPGPSWSGGTVNVEVHHAGTDWRRLSVLDVQGGHVAELERLPYLPPGIPGGYVALTFHEGGQAVPYYGEATLYRHLVNSAQRQSPPAGSLFRETYRHWEMPRRLHVRVLAVTPPGEDRELWDSRPDVYVRVKHNGRDLGCSVTLHDQPTGTATWKTPPGLVAEFTWRHRLDFSVYDEDWNEQVSLGMLPLHGVPTSGSHDWLELKVTPSSGPLRALGDCDAKGFGGADLGEDITALFDEVAYSLQSPLAKGLMRCGTQAMFASFLDEVAGSLDLTDAQNVAVSIGNGLAAEAVIRGVDDPSEVTSSLLTASGIEVLKRINPTLGGLAEAADFFACVADEAG